MVQTKRPDHNRGWYVGEMSFFVITIEFTFAIGSVSYGVIDLALPEGSSLLAQKLWASIGWSTGLLNVFDGV